MRDTDSDWRYIAKHNPYFGVLSQERYLSPDTEALAEFFASGELYVEHVERVFRGHFGEFSPATALDFGCGVGRLLIPLAKRGFGFGVDVAEDMLRLAEQHCADAGVNFALGKEIPSDRKFDWVNSVMVLQHIPPARGYGIIRDLWSAVSPGGFLSLHITVYKDRSHLGELERDIERFSYDGDRVTNYSTENDPTLGMTMYDYDLSRVLCVLDLQDGAPVYMEKANHGGCHGFRIYARKA